MNTILKTLIVSVFIALFFTTAHARNEYLNNGTNTCDQGSWEAYTEVRQNEYKSGSSAESQNQVLGWRFRKSIGDACTDEFIAEQQLQQKLKTQLELAKECKRIPRINPPPPEFAVPETPLAGLAAPFPPPPFPPVGVFPGVESCPPPPPPA